MSNISATNITLAAMIAGACIPAQAQAPTTAQSPLPSIPAGMDTPHRTINEIIVHCSATPAGRDVTAADIRRWHLQRGWADIGYHFVIRLSGEIETGRPLWLAGAHCLGHNAHSIGVCYVGGCDASMNPADTRTDAQRQALLRLLRELRALFPGVTIHGHRDYAAKACPSFDATSEFSNL